MFAANSIKFESLAFGFWPNLSITLIVNVYIVKGKLPGFWTLKFQEYLSQFLIVVKNASSFYKSFY